jgi:proline dehydrogenase
LSKYLLRSRSELPTPIPFPGCPAASDLAILDLPDVPAEFTPVDVTALKELRDDLFRICIRAKERGVRIIIDAEYR